jgi:hypothetical protein
MASTSEKGHAKNIANAKLLNTHIAQLGPIYNPSNPNLKLSNLQTIQANSAAQQKDVNILVAPYSVAVDGREAIFAPVSKKITKLRKVYKATEGVNQAQLEDFMTIARKIKGVRKTKNPPTTDPAEEQKQHSTSQMSYDARTNNMDLMIALFQNTTNYGPNETEYQIATLQAEKDQMLQSTQDVSDAFVPLNKARGIRNTTMYNAPNNLVTIFNTAKDYLFTILDSKSVDYKAISKIKFTKI